MLAAVVMLAAGCAGRLVAPVYSVPPPGSTNPPVIVGYTPNTNAVAGIGTAGAVGGMLPPPLGTIVGGAASLLLAGLGAYARIKTNQVNKTQDILTAVITGVEAVGKFPGVSVKETIATHVAAAGYSDEFDKTVQAVAKTVP